MGVPVLESTQIASITEDTGHGLYGDHNRITKHKNSLWVGPNKVSLVRSSLNQGHNRHSGNPYARWQTDYATGFYRAKSGVVIPYRYEYEKMQGRHGSFRNKPFVSPLLTLLSDDFTAAIKTTFDIESVMDLYPVAKHYGIESYNNIYPTLKAPERSDNMRDFCAKVFGKKNMRKDLVRSAAEANQWQVAYASLFRGLVPVDWIVGFLRDNKDREIANEYQGPLVVNQDFRGMLTQLNPKSYKHLLKEELDTRAFGSMFNLQRQYRQGGIVAVDADKVYRTIDDIHGEIEYPQYQPRVVIHADQLQMPLRYVPEKLDDVEIEHNAVAKELHGLKAGKFEIRLATNTDDLMDWGKYMHNCIAGYRHQAVQKQGIYGAVMDGDRVIANLEIRGKTLVQLLARFNQSLPEKTREQVVKALRGKEIKCDQYWGSST